MRYCINYIGFIPHVSYCGDNRCVLAVGSPDTLILITCFPIMFRLNN